MCDATSVPGVSSEQSYGRFVLCLPEYAHGTSDYG